MKEIMRKILRPVWRRCKPLYIAVSSRMRKLPEFLIPGEAKCGTYAVHHYLSQHPAILMAKEKEPHFFNNNFYLGVNWYRQFFPWLWQKKLTGESSADYFFHPRSAPNIARILPECKLVIVFRDPVERAFSHYRHNLRPKPWIRDGRPEISENLSFEDALEAEEERLSGERDRLLADPRYYSWNHEHYSYKARGRYIEQLEYWMNYFDRSQMLIIQGEELALATQEVYDRILSFLGLPGYSLPDTRRYHENPVKGQMRDETRLRLKEYFEPYNRRLYEKLNVSWRWQY